MTGPTLPPEYSWRTAACTYEGFPLYLRWPQGLNYDELQSTLPLHLTVTHEFSMRRTDGAPEPRYNDTLEDFDIAVTSYFATSRDGCPVLVETFGGKRNYYFYTKATVVPETVAGDLSARFPGHRLSATARTDSSWRFIRQYAKDFLDEG